MRMEDGRSDRWLLEILRADVLMDPFGDQTLDPPCIKAALNYHRKPPFWDVLISNPPYISRVAYWKTTTRSVRAFEPKLALVPPASATDSTDAEQGDRFFPRLLAIAKDVEAKIVLFEVADVEQAMRVARMAGDLGSFDGIEIWRDQPDHGRDNYTTESVETDIPVIGSGNARSVLCWRGAGTAWLGKSNNCVNGSTNTLEPESFEDLEPCSREPVAILQPSFDFTRVKT